MGLREDKFDKSLDNIVDQIKEDGNWKYSQVAKQTFEKERKADRSFNCAQGVCYVLKDAGILPEEGWFYFAYGKLYIKGNDKFKKTLKKKFKVVDLKKEKIQPRDIIGFSGMSHTAMYIGDGKYADFGSKANVNGIKKKIIAKHTYGSHKPNIALRLKTRYYPKYKGDGESIQKALESLGCKGSYKKRCNIARYNGINDYSGTEEQNKKMLSLLKKGKLIR